MKNDLRSMIEPLNLTSAIMSHLDTVYEKVSLETTSDGSQVQYSGIFRHMPKGLVVGISFCIEFLPVNQYDINLTAAYWNPIIQYVSETSGVKLSLKIGRTSADTTAYVLAQLFSGKVPEKDMKAVANAFANMHKDAKHTPARIGARLATHADRCDDGQCHAG